MIIIYLIAGLIYVLSGVGCYMAYRNVYTYRWNNLEPEALDIYVTMMPFANTIAALILATTYCEFKARKDFRKNIPSKFFNL